MKDINTYINEEFFKNVGAGDPYTIWYEGQDQKFFDKHKMVYIDKSSNSIVINTVYKTYIPLSKYIQYFEGYKISDYDYNRIYREMDVKFYKYNNKTNIYDVLYMHIFELTNKMEISKYLSKHRRPIYYGEI